MERVARAGLWAVAMGALLLSGSGAVAGEPVITLEDAIRMALADNHDMLLARAETARAQAAAEAARGGRRPQAGLESTVSRSTNPTTVFSQLLGQERFTADNFALDTLNEPDPLTNFTTRVSVSQSVWSGGMRKGTAEAAAGMSEAAALDESRRRQEVIQRVVEAYAAALLARDQEQVAREALRTARAHVDMARDLKEGGLAVEAEVLRAQVRESEMEEMLAAAQGQGEIALATLNLVLGRDHAAPLALADLEDAPPAPAATADLEALVAEAWSRRSDLQAAAARSRAAGWQRQAAGGGRLPEIVVAGTAEANSDSLLEVDGTNWTALAGLRWSLWSGGERRARVAEAVASQKAADLSEDLLRQRVALEVRQAVTSREVAGRRLELAGRAEKLAAAALEVVTDRYREGLVQQVALLDAEDELTRARTRRASARREVQVAASMLELALGRLDGGRS